MFNKIKGFIYGLSKWSCLIGNACIVLNMMIVVVNVFMRGMFGRPFTGVVDVVSFTSCIIVVLTISYTEVLGGHINVDFIVALFPVILQKIIFVIISLLNIIIAAALAFCFMNYTFTSAAAGTTSMTAKLPYAPFLAVCTLGMILFVLTIIVKTVDKLLNWEGGVQE